MSSGYIQWLQKQGFPLFEGGGIWWSPYHGALVPAHVRPCFIETNAHEALSLLKKSGAWFLRYSSQPSQEETAWYYLVSDSYDLKNLSRNMRNQIKRGHRMCAVEQVSAEFLAENGYSCYVSAFQRYRNATPLSQHCFRTNILKYAGGPFEYWCVFTKDKKVAGYCKLDLEDNHVSTTVLKYAPAGLKNYSSYAIMDTLLNHYVVERGMTLNNGNRSISHDTSIQDFLLKFGFKRQFCKLCIVYSPILDVGIQLAFPLRKFIVRLPEFWIISKLKALLIQEVFRRSFTN